MSLVLENKPSKAINFLKMSENKSNTNFFEAYILLILDSIKKDNLDEAIDLLLKIPKPLQEERINFILLNSLKQYVYTFKEKRLFRQIKTLVTCHLLMKLFKDAI